MTLRENVERYLENEPRARERKLRSRAVVNILLEFYPGLTGHKDTLIEFCKDYETATRVWRDVLQFRPDLRGSDYGDKKVLEQNTMLKLDSDRVKKTI